MAKTHEALRALAREKKEVSIVFFHASRSQSVTCYPTQVNAPSHAGRYCIYLPRRVESRVAATTYCYLLAGFTESGENTVGRYAVVLIVAWSVFPSVRLWRERSAWQK